MKHAIREASSGRTKHLRMCPEVEYSETREEHSITSSTRLAPDCDKRDVVEKARDMKIDRSDHVRHCKPFKDFGFYL